MGHDLPEWAEPRKTKQPLISPACDDQIFTSADALKRSKTPVMKILVIHRRSDWADISEGADPLIRGYVQQGDPIVDRILRAHEAHEESMEKVRAALARRGAEAVWRHDFSGVVPDRFDLVITLGGDGTVLHVSHFIGTVPILSINSSPETSIGYFAAGDADNVPEILDRIEAGAMPRQRLFRMEVMLNGEVVNSRVLNDVLFSNVCPASTTRYHLRWEDRAEDQVSSGLWISTAAGSTAALRAAGGSPMNIGSDRIQFVVREPCHGGGRRNLSLPTLVKGSFGPGGAF